MPPEQLLLASLLEQLDDNLLISWVVGLIADDPI